MIWRHRIIGLRDAGTSAMGWERHGYNNELKQALGMGDIEGTRGEKDKLRAASMSRGEWQVL